MSDDPSYVSIHPQIKRELDLLSGECERRHLRQNEAILVVSQRSEKLGERVAQNRECLVELVGRDGRNGKFAALSKRQDATDAKMDRLMARTAGGAIAGGGAVAGLIEALRVLLGG